VGFREVGRQVGVGTEIFLFLRLRCVWTLGMERVGVGLVEGREGLEFGVDVGDGSASSPGHAHELVHLERVDGLLGFVDGVHHVLVDLAIDKDMLSVLVVQPELGPLGVL
jgi:hypothetical protein